MKLLRCKGCGELTTEPYVRAQVQFNAQFYEDDGVEKIIFLDPDFDLSGDTWRASEVTMHCHNCDDELEIIEVEQCPHRWRNTFHIGTPRQRCDLCHAERTGRVVFD